MVAYVKRVGTLVFDLLLAAIQNLELKLKIAFAQDPIAAKKH